MADTTNPPPSSYGPALFADWSKVKIDSPSSAPRDSVRYMTWELSVLLEAEPHYRAKGNACDGGLHEARHRGPTAPDRCETGRRRPLFSRGARSRALENPGP